MNNNIKDYRSITVKCFRNLIDLYRAITTSPKFNYKLIKAVKKKHKKLNLPNLIEELQIEDIMFYLHCSRRTAWNYLRTLEWIIVFNSLEKEGTDWSAMYNVVEREKQESKLKG